MVFGYMSTTVWTQCSFGVLCSYGHKINLGISFVVNVVFKLATHTAHFWKVKIERKKQMTFFLYFLIVYDFIKASVLLVLHTVAITIVYLLCDNIISLTTLAD